jgi:hypothetical protein
MTLDETTQYKIPRELERRSPRRVQRKAKSLGCGLVGGRLFIMPHMIVGVVMLFGVLPVKLATVTVGEVYQGRITGTSTKSGSKGRTNYNLQYSYEADGQTHKGERSIKSNEYERLSRAADAEPAETLEVRALNIAGYQTEEAFFPNESRAKPVLFVLLFALFWNAILSVFVFILWVAPWMEKRLYKYGKPVVGRVVKMHTKHAKSTSYHLDYEFDHPGLGQRIATMIVPYDRWQQAREGESVTVLCHPHRKRPTLIYEYGDFVCL